MADLAMTFKVYVLVERVAVDPSAGDEFTDEVTDGLLYIGENDTANAVKAAIDALANKIEPENYNIVSQRLTQMFRPYRPKGK